jgi:hypothetical protein
LKKIIRYHIKYLYGFGRNEAAAKEMYQLSIVAEELALKEIGYLFVELMLYSQGSEASMYANWETWEVRNDVVSRMSKC